MADITKNPMYRFLLVLTVSSTLGFQAWRTLFNNFAHDVAQLSGQHVGVIQSVREIPGFLALLAVYVLLVMREHKLSALSVLALGLGVSMTGFFPSFAGLTFTTLLMSFGFHYFETTNQSLTLQYFDKATAPRVFGNLRGLAAGANIAAGLIIFVVTPYLAFREIYLLMGGVVVAAAGWAFLGDPTDKDLVPQRKRMVFRGKYWLFYFLTFMAGARRQIFVAFAVFLLVQRFDYSVREVTALFVANNVINYFLSPYIGKAIVRFGERRVLSLEYGSLVLVFLAYALVDNRWIGGVLYVLDHIFFNFAIAIRTYFQKIGDPRDVAPSMAVGFTINHIGAVVLPALGGVLWMVDFRIVFYMGAAMAAVSLVAVQAIRTEDAEVLVVGK
ncbi:MAG: MFS transporter [Desulfatibacillaceae bacterium]